MNRGNGLIEVELVGGPRDGERRKIERAAGHVRFNVSMGRGKPKVELLYRRRPTLVRSAVVYYDYAPQLAA